LNNSKLSKKPRRKEKNKQKQNNLFKFQLNETIKTASIKTTHSHPKNCPVILTKLSQTHEKKNVQPFFKHEPLSPEKNPYNNQQTPMSTPHQNSLSSFVQSVRAQLINFEPKNTNTKNNNNKKKEKNKKKKKRHTRSISSSFSSSSSFTTSATNQLKEEEKEEKHRRKRRRKNHQCDVKDDGYCRVNGWDELNEEGRRADREKKEEDKKLDINLVDDDISDDDDDDDDDNDDDDLHFLSPLSLDNDDDEPLYDNHDLNVIETKKCKDVNDVVDMRKKKRKKKIVKSGEDDGLDRDLIVLDDSDEDKDDGENCYYNDKDKPQRIRVRKLVASKSVAMDQQRQREIFQRLLLLFYFFFSFPSFNLFCFGVSFFF